MRNSAAPLESQFKTPFTSATTRSFEACVRQQARSRHATRFWKQQRQSDALLLDSVSTRRPEGNETSKLRCAYFLRRSRT